MGYTVIPQNVSCLKSHLRQASGPHIGKFGELIYAQYMSGLGYEVERLHEEQADYFVHGIGRVDVKTKGLTSATTRLSKRAPETTYCFIDLEEAGISMVHDDDVSRVPTPSALISWEEAFDLWARRPYKIKRKKSVLSVKLDEKKKELVRWIAGNWNLKAAVVYREGRQTQNGFASGKEPWGPDTFHASAGSRRSLDLKVLIFFEGEGEYKVMAYPMRLWDRIKWGPARGSKNRFAFDPEAIDPIFVFADIADFQANFPKRFL